MFDHFTPAPADAIFGLAEQYRNDPSPDKINLIIGVYQNTEGITPILQCVREAEKLIAANEKSKTYLPIDGLARYNDLVANLVIGNKEIVERGNSVTVQTPGGSGALRLVGDLLVKLGKTNIWVSNPTWANHCPIFETAGMTIQKYPMLDFDGTGLDFDSLLETVEKIPSGDALLLHAVCHNPTGVDFSLEQWASVANVVQSRDLIPVLDFAYQGFGTSVEADRRPIEMFIERGCNTFICNSFSKNMGLYGERVGALTAVTESQSTSATLLSHMKRCVRTNYSNPPCHGASIVANVLGNEILKDGWFQELEEMRQRILSLRQEFVAQMNRVTGTDHFDFVGRQRGMFSYSGLTAEQAQRLREEFAIYIVGSGRINVAGIQLESLPRLCEAIGTVIDCPTKA